MLDMIATHEQLQSIEGGVGILITALQSTTSLDTSCGVMNMLYEYYCHLIYPLHICVTCGQHVWSWSQPEVLARHAVCGIPAVTASHKPTTCTSREHFQRSIDRTASILVGRCIFSVKTAAFFSCDSCI